MIAAPVDGLTKTNFTDRWQREIHQKIKTTIPTGHNARVKAHRKAEKILRQLGPQTNYLKKEIDETTKKQVRRTNDESLSRQTFDSTSWEL